MDKYKLVPVEPTPDMLAAGHYAMVDGYHPGGIYADMLAAAPSAHGPLSLSDEKILEIASNPMSTPCSPWWLKGDVKAGDVQNAAIAFAKAVLKAAAPGVQMGVVSWQPIETVPKGESVDLCTVYENGMPFYYPSCYWREGGVLPEGWVSRYFSCERRVVKNATHWKPLTQMPEVPA